MSGDTIGKIISTAGTVIGALLGLTGFIVSAADKASKAAQQNEAIKQAVHDELLRLQQNSGA